MLLHEHPSAALFNRPPLFYLSTLFAGTQKDVFDLKNVNEVYFLIRTLSKPISNSNITHDKKEKGQP